jgi:long-chain acyl-CoA synthetase
MSDTLMKRFYDAVVASQGKAAITCKKDDAWVDISYIELKQAIDGISEFLAKEQVGKNDKVSLIMKNRPEWPFLFFAIVSRGAIVVPVSPDAEGGEIIRILNDSGARLVFLGNESNHLDSEITNRCVSVKKVISVDAPIFNQALKEPPNSKANIEVCSDDIACILYTSGTTDDPKGVMLSHANLLSNADSIKSFKIITENERILSILPLHHIYPLTVTMIIPLVFGGTIIYPRTILGEGLLEAMSRTNPTAFVGVPQVFYIFHQKITDALKRIPFPLRIFIDGIGGAFYAIRMKTGINLSRILFKKMHRRFGRSMRLFISGGAKLDEKVEKDLLKFGFTILEGYGLTETSPILTLNPPGRIKIGSAGLPIPGVTIKISKPDEKGAGEVMARGPNIMKGYYKRDNLTAQVLKDGWFCTGDLGYIDKEGYLFLTGRSKDLIVLSSGLKVYPDEIERIYGVCAPIKELCVFEAPTGKGLEGSRMLWAMVVPNLDFFKKKTEVNLREVIKMHIETVSTQLALHKRLMGFTITMEPLPRTLLGKLKRFIVKEKYLTEIINTDPEAQGVKEASAEELLMMEGDIAKKVMGYLKNYASIDRGVLPRDSLELDLGVDSLGRVEIVSELEKILRLKVSDELTSSVFTVKDLIIVCERLASENADFEKTAQDGADVVLKVDSGDWGEKLKALPEGKRLKEIDIKPSLISNVVHSFIIGLIKLFFKMFYRLEVEGSANVPKKGPYIIYANHTSFFDGLLIAASVPRYARPGLFFMGFKMYFDLPVIRNLIKIGKIIPLDFSANLLESLRSANYVIKNGKGVCFFPEGRLGIDGKIHDFKKGFGILAKESGAMLIPAFIDGAINVWPRTRRLPKLCRIKVKFGVPLTSDEAPAARDALIKLSGVLDS